MAEPVNICLQTYTPWQGMPRAAYLLACPLLGWVAGKLCIAYVKSASIFGQISI